MASGGGSVIRTKRSFTRGTGGLRGLHPTVHPTASVRWGCPRRESEPTAHMGWGQYTHVCDSLSLAAVLLGSHDCKWSARLRGAPRQRGDLGRAIGAGSLAVADAPCRSERLYGLLLERFLLEDDYTPARMGCHPLPPEQCRFPSTPSTASTPGTHWLEVMEAVGPWVKRQNYGGSTTARRQTMKSQFRHSVTGASTGLWRP